MVSKDPARRFLLNICAVISLLTARIQIFIAKTIMRDESHLGLALDAKNMIFLMWALYWTKLSG